MVDVMNYFDLNYTIFGNHKFNFGPAQASKLIKASHFSWLSSNLINKKAGKPFTGGVRWVTIDWHGVRADLTGNRLGLTSAERLNDIQVAQQPVPILKDGGTQIVIALTHMFMPYDEALAKGVPRITHLCGRPLMVPRFGRVAPVDVI